MSKRKYKITIPDLIKMMDLDVAYAANLINPEFIIENDVLETECISLNFGDIPKEWLEEIIEEPVSSSEFISLEYWFAEECEDWGNNAFSAKDMKECFESAEANNELRHRETIDWQECCEYCADGIVDKRLRDFAERLWVQYNKSRGFTDED